ncbi:MAG: DUF1598 domain-containing protein [Thermodesulfobacteriota bacterium]
MKRIRWARTILIFAFILWAPGTETAFGSSPYRAFSLRVLQDTLKSNPGGVSMRDIQQMAGITRIRGYILDKSNRDIVIFGEVETGYPALQLDDFVVALRNTWLKYAQVKDGAYLYLAPYCSIEPDLRAVEGLKRAGQQISNASDAGRVEPVIKQWEQYCSIPQNVVIKGIPLHTHFASVLVNADYAMKKLAVGCDKVQIGDFASLPDMTLEKLKSDLAAEGRSKSASSIGNRFWFYPGEIRFLEEEGIVTLETCQVTLLTEESYLGQSGQIRGEGKTSEVAESFSQRFTKLYLDIAAVKPVYIEFQNLFDILALSKGMRFKAHQETVSLDLGYLLEKCQTARTTVDQNLPGESTVTHFEQPVELSGKRQIAKVWVPFCGGVAMNIDVNSRHFQRDRTGRLAGLRQKILESRPGPDALSWSFSF